MANKIATTVKNFFNWGDNSQNNGNAEGVALENVGAGNGDPMVAHHDNGDPVVAHHDNDDSHSQANHINEQDEEYKNNNHNEYGLPEDMEDNNVDNELKLGKINMLDDDEIFQESDMEELMDTEVNNDSNEPYNETSDGSGGFEIPRAHEPALALVPNRPVMVFQALVDPPAVNQFALNRHEMHQSAANEPVVNLVDVPHVVNQPVVIQPGANQNVENRPLNCPVTKRQRLSPSAMKRPAALVLPPSANPAILNPTIHLMPVANQAIPNTNIRVSTASVPDLVAPSKATDCVAAGTKRQAENARDTGSKRSRSMSQRRYDLLRATVPIDPDEEKVVNDLAATLNQIEDIRREYLEEDYALAELKENLKEFKRLKNQLIRASEKAATSYSARREMERINAQVLAFCGDVPELRGPLRDFRKFYSACMKLGSKGRSKG